jgi:hypothetical protein
MLLMPTAKKIGLSILSSLFVFLLFAAAFDIGLVRTFTHPDTVKRLVKESGVYNGVVPNVLTQTKNIPTAYGDIPVSDPAITRAVNAALPPGYIQENTELAMDNIYDWLDGQIPQPNFNIDFSGAKTLFANNIADSLQKRMATLPACSAAQSLAIAQSGSFNAYSATCVPRGVSPSVVAEQVRNSIIGQGEFLKNTNISALSIKDSSGHPLFSSQLASAPRYYQWLKKLPIILGILTILCALGVVFLSSTWQRGLRHIGVVLMVIGLIMLLFSWGFNRAVNKDITPKINVNNAILQQDLRALIPDVGRQIGNNYRFFGGLYIILGVVSIATAQLAGRKPGPESRGSMEAGHPAPPQRQTEQPAAPPKSKAG